MTAGSLRERLRSVAPGRLPVVVQSEAAECALACLCMIAGYYGGVRDLATLRRRLPTSLKGASLAQMMAIGAELGLTARAVRVTLDGLRRLALPAVLHWNFDHFVVLKRVGRRWADVHDPACGARRYRLDEVSNHFTGVALELAPAPDFRREPPVPRMPLATLIGRTIGLKRSLVTVLLLSGLAQAFALASPFYVQTVVDEVLVKHDVDLLAVLALGFLLLAGLAVLSKLLRGLAELHLASQLNLSFGSRLFRHLIRLPMAYFERRTIGDVLSRFGSLKPLQDLITGAATATVIDGVMAIGALALMIAYAPGLAVVVLASVLLYALLRAGLYRSDRNRTQDQILAGARAETCLVESVQGVRGIKSFGREVQRDDDWQNRLVDVINGGVRVRRLELGHEAGHGLISGAEHVLVIYIGAQLVLIGQMSLGMLYAFLAFRNHFAGAAVSLVDQLIKLRMLGLHRDRLADILLTEPDPAARPLPVPARQVRRNVRLAGIGHSYGVGEAPVLCGINLSLPLGSFTALSGPSGSGKSTLLKILAGQLSPQSGDLEVDGLPLQTFGACAYRAAVAAVMQDDRLLSGSLQDAITFFDPRPDAARLEQAARAALIFDEIMRLPMALETRIGDMGGVLSAGQAQRLLIARALYQRPSILLLDEGTAHLDEERERLIMGNLRALGLTCVYSSHRASIVALADQCLELPSGHLRTAPAP